jgi:hypothetical protein
LINSVLVFKFQVHGSKEEMNKYISWMSRWHLVLGGNMRRTHWDWFQVCNVLFQEIICLRTDIVEDSQEMVFIECIN